MKRAMNHQFDAGNELLSTKWLAFNFEIFQFEIEIETWSREHTRNKIYITYIARLTDRTRSPAEHTRLHQAHLNLVRTAIHKQRSDPLSICQLVFCVYVYECLSAVTKIIRVFFCFCYCPIISKVILSYVFFFFFFFCHIFLCVLILLYRHQFTVTPCHLM